MFVCFLEEIDDPKNHFEIDWPLNVLFFNDYSVSNCNDNDDNGHVYLTEDTIMIYASERLSSSGLIGDDGKFTAPIAGAYEFKIYTRTVSTRCLIGSTDQAMILMNRLFFCPLGFLQGLRSKNIK